MLANCGLLDPKSIDEYLARGGYTRPREGARTGMTPRRALPTPSSRPGCAAGAAAASRPARKWTRGAQRAARTPRSTSICNADEGDPGRLHGPRRHRGRPAPPRSRASAIAAYAIGATKAYVYLRAEYPLAIKRLLHASALEARPASTAFLGEHILGSPASHLEIVIKQGAGAFVCGEETALLQHRRRQARHAAPAAAVPGAERGCSASRR
ncbi:MAG: hypothetical protein AB2L07_14555 [Thermoanaerobaculaceae bacterium]